MIPVLFFILDMYNIMLLCIFGGESLGNFTTIIIMVLWLE